MPRTPPPAAEQMVHPDAQVAADGPTIGEWFSCNPDDLRSLGEWFSCNPDDLSDPSCKNIRASGFTFANSCFKKKKDVNTYASPGTYRHIPRPPTPLMLEIISSLNDVGLSDSDPRSLRSKFEITEIGKGNFGAVFKARNKKNNESYAIKRIMKELDDDKKRKKAMKEVDIWKCLGTHDNLVEMLDHCIEENNLYILMELCESCLSEKKKHFDYGEIKKLLYQLSNVLDFIHGRRIAHLDVKPANIYLSNGVYKIGDFGCSASTRSKRRIEGGDDQPDEMLEGSYKDLEKVDVLDLEKVDVFSLGASCCELIKGDDQFNPRAGVSDLVLPLEFPKEFGCLIKSMMHPNPEQRPSPKTIMNHTIFDEFGKDVA